MKTLRFVSGQISKIHPPLHPKAETVDIIQAPFVRTLVFS